MSRRFTSWLVTLVTVLTLFNHSAAARQPKPDPKPLDRQGDPEPDLRKWAQAYESANEPRVLVICGIDAGVIPNRGGTSVWWNLDPAGEPAQIANALEEILNPGDHPIQLVDANALSRMKGRFENALGQLGEIEAIEMLRNELNVDLLITIRIAAKQPDPSVTVTASEEARARRGFTSTFDWKLGFSALNIKTNVSVLASKFIDDFAKRTDQQFIKMTLRIMDFSPSALRVVRDSLTSLPDVKSVKLLNQSVSPNSVFAEFDVTHAAHADGGTLLFDACDALSDSLDVYATSELSQGNSAIIRITSKPTPPPAPIVPIAPVPKCAELLMQDDPDTMDELRQLYKNKGVPHITVILNRKPLPEEIDAARAAAAANGQQGEVNVQHMIVVAGGGPAVGVHNPDNDKEAPNQPEKDNPASENLFRKIERHEGFARTVETAMSRFFGVDWLEFVTADPDTTREALQRTAAKQNNIMREEELGALIRGLDPAGISVIGYAQDLNDGNVQFSFKAVTGAGIELGFGQLVTKFVNDQDLGSIEKIAKGLVADIACGMRKSWTPPSRITVRLLGATGLEDFAAFRDAIETFGAEDVALFGSEQFDRSHGEGIAVFRLEYQVSSSKLFDKLKEINEQADTPFEVFDAEKKDDSNLDIRIRASAGGNPTR